jgi:hypothetical protein
MVRVAEKVDKAAGLAVAVAQNQGVFVAVGFTTI